MDAGGLAEALAEASRTAFLTPTMPNQIIITFLASLACAASSFAVEDLCAQPSPEEMAKVAGVTLPRGPWHVANIWWDFEKPIEHFTSLEIDVTIDRDVPSDYNLYVSPCGVA